MNQPELRGMCHVLGRWLAFQNKQLGSEKRYRIAHLSDLHFGRHFNTELWCYLEGLLQHEYCPDLIVVTGDIVDTPSLFGLGIAHQQLAELQQKVGCECLFVPGNHDVGILGNVALWPWSGKVRLVFHEKNRDHFKRLPTFIDHRNKLWWKRWYDRAKWIFRFSIKRAFAWKKYFTADGAAVLADPGLEAFPLIDDPTREIDCAPNPSVSPRVVIAGFDSNEKLRLATGRVDSDRILSLQLELNKMRESWPDRSLCPRIALVHHHPLPIAYSDTAESLTAFEPFLVFRNAGSFLHALGSLQFDLVLHGHKHYWHFARLSFEAPGSAASELVVISAGSGTIKHEEPGRNSFNLIDIMPNGSIAHRPVFYGKGMTTVAASHLDMRTEPRQLFSLDTIKSKAHGKGIARQGLECDLVERSIKINDDGAADLGTSVNGLRVLSQVELMIGVRTGRIVPACVELTETSKRLGHILKVERNDPPTHGLRIPIDLGHDLYSDGEGVSYGVTCRLINTYSITEWENDQLRGLGDNDDNVASMMIRFPTKRLRLAVTLPSGLIRPKPKVVCWRIPSYPLINFDKDGFAKAEGGRPVRDQEMTQHEQGGLKRTGSNSWTLEITEPMVGFGYDIRWRVKTRGIEVPLRLRGETDQLRRSLLSLLDTKLPDKLAEVKARGQTMLDRLLRLLVQDFRSKYAHDEGLVAAIFVYDPGRDPGRNELPALRLLYDSGPGRDVYERCERIPLNEGVVGRAFKVRDLSVYILPELLRKRQNVGVYVYYPDRRPAPETDRYSVLVALPLYLGVHRLGKHVSPEEVVGVFTLGSNARDSRLLRLFRETDSVASGQSRIVFDALFQVALDYIRGLAAALANAAPGVEDGGQNPDNTGRHK